MLQNAGRPFPSRLFCTTPAHEPEIRLELCGVKGQSHLNQNDLRVLTEEKQALLPKLNLQSRLLIKEKFPESMAHFSQTVINMQSNHHEQNYEII